MLRSISLLAAFLATSLCPGLAAELRQGIRPWSEDPRYWQYDGKPIRLVGGSQDDNLFQISDLAAHLEEIKAAGGNYVRNTMSDRRGNGHEVYPFAKREDGKYDLELWNEEYWDRFENLLQLTAERGIIAQIEIWDRFDYSRENWPPHPYCPKNNVNYTSEESGLAAEYPAHPGKNEQPFFFTVPALENNQVLLKYQQVQVDKLLSYSLRFPNVLYCIDNETSGKEEWSTYWSEYIRREAQEAGADVFITEMWDDWDVKSGRHVRTYDHPDRYDFVDISQNNHNTKQRHWDNLMWVRNHLADEPRPINHVKIYGSDGGRHGGDDRDAVEKFWRNLIGGAASVRFHRPPGGIGLSETAKQHLTAFRTLEAACDLFHCEPDAKSEHLSDRQANEAYLAFEPGRQYVIYFPQGGEVTLDISMTDSRFDVRWLDLETDHWTDADDAVGGNRVRLRSPTEGHTICLLTRR